MEKMDGKTMGIVAENVGKLKELFPEAFTEGKVDFEALKEVLGTFVDDRDERFSFTWNGKSKARMIAQTPSTGTLRPCKEESVDWNTTQNIFIEGDNLEVLKLLQKSYHKKVKMIYIDPPYNTGKDFVYKDNFKDNIKNYKEITGQVDGEGRNLSNNPETSGRYHTDWLNMMYPRLRLAKNLLKDDGVIFISIGKEEVHNLISIMNEIFGEECFKNIIVIRRGIKSVQAQFETIDSFNRGHEYLLFYSKNADFRFNKCLVPHEASDEESIIEGSWNNHWRGTDRPTMRYELFGIKPKTGQWRWGEERSKQAKDNWIMLCDEIGSNASQSQIDKWVADKELKESRKYDLLRLSNTGKPEHYIRPSEGKLASDFWSDVKPNGGSQLKKCMGDKFFDTPKSVDLIERLTTFLCESDDIILDYFAGSATTAHAVMQLNAEDSGNRKFIMVQLPETTDEKSEACKAGYKTIAEISKERIRRASAKLKEDNPDYIGDLGFKVFKLDSTNIKPWEVDFDMTERTLEDFISNIKPDRREEDVLYEILLKYGLDLTLPISEHTIAGQKVFDIGMGALIICLADAISLETVEGMAKLKEELNPEIMRVVFKDSGFADDVVKTNAVQILKQAGIVDVRSL